MNKGVLIAIVAVVVVGAGAWYVMGRGGAGAPTPMGETSQTQSGGMQQLMAQGTAKCTVSSEANGVTSNGTVFVSNGKVRGAFTSTGGGMGTQDSNMIVRDGYVYVWSSAMPQGMKMVAQASGEAAAGAQPTPYDATYNYDCDSWQADESQFALPSGITFVEFNSSAGATGGASGAPSGPSCAQCDMVPAESRAQCRAALNCN